MCSTDSPFNIPVAILKAYCVYICRYMYAEGMKLAKKYEEEEAELAAKLKVRRWVEVTTTVTASSAIKNALLCSSALHLRWLLR
jgi:hypothetical protein